jgi:hypothetical protein
VVWLLGLEQQQRRRPMMRQPMLGIEVRIAGAHDAVAREETGGAVVRV